MAVVWDSPIQPLNSPFGIRVGALLFRKAHSRKDHMGQACRLRQEEILDNEKFKGFEGVQAPMAIGIARDRVCSREVEGLQIAPFGRIEHLDGTPTRLLRNRLSPGLFKSLSRLLVADILIAR